MLPAHTAMAFAIDGFEQVAHDVAVPHWVRLLLGKHCDPVPGHMCESAPHDVPHTPAELQVALAPPGQGVHAPSAVPQVATSESATHTPEHRWNPSLQLNPQAPLVQVRTAFATVGQGVQLVPQEFTLVLDKHIVGLVAGQAWKLVLQASPHVGVAPADGAAQVGPPLAGSAHAMHEVPHELTLVLLLATQVALAPVPHRW